jgi:pimeloyl-ACP methyl ester carboxylesterase
MPATMTLILVPGLLCDAAVWEPQIKALDDLARIEVADHGALDSLDAMAAAILARAPARFALAGHSMGGRVAFEVMRRARDRVEALAILDSACHPLPAGAAGEREAAGRWRLAAKARTDGMRAAGEEWLKIMIPPARYGDRALTTAILDMIERKTPEIFEAQIRALLGRPDARPLLSTVTSRTLVLCGRDDAWCPPAQHEEMAGLIAHSRLVVIPECGHMATLERPAAVNAAMRDWLTGR